MTKYLNDEKTHSAINSKLFKRLNFINEQLYEVQLVKSEIEQENQSLSDSSCCNMPSSDCWKTVEMDT